GAAGAQSLSGGHADPARRAPSKPSPGQAAQARLDPGQGADQPRLCRDAPADALAEPRHGVRGSRLPEHRRMLDQEARHRDDPGRHLHPGVRLLQRQDRHAAGGGPPRAGACRNGRGGARAGAYRGHQCRPGRPARRRRVAVRGGDRGAAPHHAEHDHRDPYPRLPQQVGSGRGSD
ncbi:MAG: Lipoyl synthase, partial [uncultured Sphingomonas sp.]